MFTDKEAVEERFDMDRTKQEEITSKEMSEGKLCH